MISNFFKNLQRYNKISTRIYLTCLLSEWNIDPISSPTAAPAQIQPFITLDFMQNETEVSSQECQKVLHELEGLDSQKFEAYEQGFNKCLESTLTHMKTLTSASTFENLNTDFDDLGSNYGGNQFISLGKHFA